MRIVKIVLVLFFGLVGIALCAQTARQAVVKNLTGVVELKRGQEVWMPVAIGTVLSQGDIIRTKAESSATIKLEGTSENSTVEMKENTQMKLAELFEDKSVSTQSTLLDVALGSILVKAEKLRAAGSKFEVKTPTSIVGVRGTTFSVTVEAIK
ncbi:MAG: FecR family protein [Candidatus Omnitrophica bacterium]|nr:FecR family protein [Candidatus Omnitrophota bacterium]